MIASVSTSEVLGGVRPRTTSATGARPHRDELTADWERAERAEPLVSIDPLPYFAKVAVDAELGTVVWPNGADLAPDVLHEEALSLA